MGPKKLILKERREREVAVEIMRYIAEGERLIALTRKLRDERLAREDTNLPLHRDAFGVR